MQPVAISRGNLPFSHLLKVLIIQPRRQRKQMLTVSIICLVLITVLYSLFVCLFEHKLEAAAAAHQMCPAQHVIVGVCVPRSSLGHGSSLHGRGTTFLPGFENLTTGYNKYLRPYFGGMLAPQKGAFKVSL